MNTLLSFNNDSQLKSDLLLEVERHEKLDMIAQGHYGKENGTWTGCAVGCSIHSLNLIRGKKYSFSDHSVYEKEFGIPQILARLQDRIFEGLPSEEAKRFPFRFLSVIPVGKDLTPVWKKFMVWILIDPVDGCIKYAKNEKTAESIKSVALLIEMSLTEKISPEQFREFRQTAWAARNAYAAADAAAYAADAAAYAADTAAYAAAYAARKGHFVKMSNKLIELLAAA